MREERGKFVGDLVIDEPYTLWGSVGGNVRVVDGGKFYMRGAIYGNLTVEADARVHVFGNVQGDITIYEGSKVILSGMIGGTVSNLGGRLFIDADAHILADVKTKAGTTEDKRKKPRA